MREELRAPPQELLAGASLFVDFDGTLVELAPTPGEVVVGVRLRALLAELNAHLGGRLAILSGRPAAEVAALVAPVEIRIAGSHGLERIIPGAPPESATRPPKLDAAIADLKRWQAGFPDVLIEEKPLGVAIHFRLAPELAAACRTAAERVARFADMVIQPGKMVFELKAADGDKGRALRRFMREIPFAGTRPIILGDDMTDEHAFEVAHELGGAGVLVGAMRPTAAGYRLGDVGAALEWLGVASRSLA